MLNAVAGSGSLRLRDAHTVHIHTWASLLPPYTHTSFCGCEGRKGKGTEHGAQDTSTGLAH
jgi:hypothetical protein